jgi:hypothetical protein
VADYAFIPDVLGPNGPDFFGVLAANNAQVVDFSATNSLSRARSSFAGWRFCFRILCSHGFSWD